MTSSPIPGHGPLCQESWNESRPSRVPMVQIWMLSDEWLSRYELLKNLHIKLCRSVIWTQTRTWTRTHGVTTLALLVLHAGELKIDRICSKVNQVIYSSSFISWPSFKPLAQIHFEISCWQDFISDFFQRGITPEREITWTRKKYRSAIFQWGIHI